MYLCFCDICNLPIKEGETKFQLGLNKVTHEEVDTNANQEYADDAEYLREVMSRIKTRSKNLQTFEICPNCKRVLDHFLSLRRDRVRKITLELKKLEKKKSKSLPKEK